MGTKMNGKPARTVTVVLCAALTGCVTQRDAEHAAHSDGPEVVTADIQEGIERHIEDSTRLGQGYMRVPFGGDELKLKLVRVHTEYLANLGFRRHFACVDLAGTDANVYDVDFFLDGEPGNMSVTETTIHKINGQPLYLWEQKRNKTWVRAPVKDASDVLLGVLTGRDEFEFLYRVELPELDGPTRMWIPFPESDRFQTVRVASVDVRGKQQVLRDREYGNRILFLELGPEDSESHMEIRFDVRRLEKKAYAEEGNPRRYLDPERLVPDKEEFRRISTEVLEGKKGDLVRARALYDHVIDRMRYQKHGEGWGKGDAVYACDARTGNCTDFHSYFIALARAAGIPARFAIGAAIPSTRDSGGVDGYHCWAEFHADGRWWPVDISEGDKCSGVATYYFGHHPANRFELSRGRDLVVSPGPKSGPINFLAYPVLEVDGEPARAGVRFSFTRKPARRI